MAFLFRPHRATFDESMAQVKEFQNRAELIQWLTDTVHALGANYPSTTYEMIDSKVEVSWYAVDERNGWNTHIVRLKDFGVLGFINDAMDEPTPVGVFTTPDEQVRRVMVIGENGQKVEAVYSPERGVFVVDMSGLSPDTQYATRIVEIPKKSEYSMSATTEKLRDVLEEAYAKGIEEIMAGEMLKGAVTKGKYIVTSILGGTQSWTYTGSIGGEDEQIARKLAMAHYLDFPDRSKVRVWHRPTLHLDWSGLEKS